MSFRFHVIGLPHTQTTKEYVACAYTQKVIKFCAMMKSLGHEVFLYSGYQNTAECSEHVKTVTKKQYDTWFGDHDHLKSLPTIQWDANAEYWAAMNSKVIEQMKKRIQQKDFICIIGGTAQKAISDAFPSHMSVEYGIGYYGVYAPFKVYESYAHMHYVQGTQRDDNGHYFDAVIPNYFDPADFPFRSKKDDYFLFVGRMIKRKGADIAAEIVKQVGGKLVMVGQGVTHSEPGKIVADEITIEGDHVIHLGHADAKKRGELMSRAKAVFLMSGYLEPFGGTSIEPMFCGTPVITTDWGAFPENIIQGKVGFRARTLGEGVWAAQNLDALLPPKDIRTYAIDNFSMDRVKYLYQAYFEQLYLLWDTAGWYSNWHEGISKYHRYEKIYPH